MGPTSSRTGAAAPPGRRPTSSRYHGSADTRGLAACRANRAPRRPAPGLGRERGAFRRSRACILPGVGRAAAWRSDHRGAIPRLGAVRDPAEAGRREQDPCACDCVVTQRKQRSAGYSSASSCWVPRLSRRRMRALRKSDEQPPLTPIISAWSVASDIGFTVANAPLRPRVGLQSERHQRRRRSERQRPADLSMPCFPRASTSESSHCSAPTT